MLARDVQTGPSPWPGSQLVAGGMTVGYKRDSALREALRRWELQAGAGHAQ